MAQEHVIVIGAAGGIGTEVVRALTARGATVVATSRDAARLESLDGTVQKQVLEAEDFAATQALFKESVTQNGPITGVVNCAGSVLLKAAHMTREEEYESIINSNLRTAFSVMAAAGKTMRDGGSVVLMASAAAMEGLANHEAIAAAKGGVIGLARSAAATYASNNLRVNAVAPGLVETPMTEMITSNATSLAFSEAMHALGRVGKPADIASMIAWLLDPENSWVTGQTIAVDGGLSRVRPKAKA